VKIQDLDVYMKKEFAMADNPLAIRVSDETRELFNKAVEGSDVENKGEFLRRLLLVYQAGIAKERSSALRPAIEAVETLTGRLIEVLNGTGAIIETEREEGKQEIEKERASFDETRAILQKRISSLEQERVETGERMKAMMSASEAAKSKIEELQRQIGQLESAARDKAALVEEYKGKNDTLNGIISEQKAAAAESRALSDTVKNLTQENEKLKRQHEDLKKSLTDTAKSHKQENEELKRQQEHLKNSLILEKDTALLELKSEFQAKLEEQQNRHTAAINDYENKVRELLSVAGATVARPLPEE